MSEGGSGSSGARSARRMAPLTLENLADLPAACRRCVAWELEPAAADPAAAVEDPAFEKEAWLSSLLLGWDAAGRVAYVGDAPVGYLSVAPRRTCRALPASRPHRSAPTRCCS